MTWKAKHGKIFRKPKIKKKIYKRGTGRTDGPRMVWQVAWPLSDLPHFRFLDSALSLLKVRLSKGIWVILNIWAMRGCKPVPMAGRAIDVYFLCSHSSRTLETDFLTSFSPRIMNYYISRQESTLCNYKISVRLCRWRKKKKETYTVH